MDIVIISATPRTASQSNTAMFIQAFSEGLSQAGASATAFYLADRSQWPAAHEAFLNNCKIIFMLPVFVGGVPSIMVEFMQQLENACPKIPQNGNQRNISFVVNAGLPMNHDFQFCAQFLKTLPKRLNSKFAGVVGIGDTISIDCIESKRNEASQKLRDWGKAYANNNGAFSSEETFWMAKDITLEKANAYCRLINRFMRHVSAAQGCEESVEQRPYA